MDKMSHSVTPKPDTASPEQQAAIYALEYTERCALLVTSIIENNRHNPIAPVLDLIKFTNVMANYLNPHDRVIVANSFRDCADLLENKYIHPDPVGVS